MIGESQLLVLIGSIRDSDTVIRRWIKIATVERVATSCRFIFIFHSSKKVESLHLFHCLFLCIFSSMTGFSTLRP